MFADFERIAGVLEKLKDRKLAIAFSGGVDSVTLARAAETVLGKNNILLLFADSVFAPAREKNFALEWAASRRLQCITVPFAPLDKPQIAANGIDRCYCCKKALFECLLQTAREHGFNTLADGENLDDQLDYRPGSQAADELGIRHIFVEAGLDKVMIRDLAHDFALPNSQAPASACLASRIPCGTVIDALQLSRIDRAENVLLDLGFAGSRVRCYGDLAKVEVDPLDLEKLWKMRRTLQSKLQETGFRRVAVDLAGYSRGAVNGVNNQ